ncbi:RelE-like toxin of type II toxin-antitoxin system HigB [Ectothiorhodospira magna]|uniref:RelE-like toxin of type II toxin-antitoxin system HigB n=1 Tax=Ectothiorhodospira magna TaxID=867345 RepID=A0A1H9G8J1_9GAMM|nr:type II toxin-antitoxin system RelE/ParE family toxin [Ectothiorhodospira magna]SEQ46475.1 RelE-like toxin of type II toxin-antitoxin system HigB [Ectothiorhodospira magna]
MEACVSPAHRRLLPEKWEASPVARQRLGRGAVTGNLSEHWSVSVSGNWRLTFKFDNGDAILVDYQDYH